MTPARTASGVKSEKRRSQTRHSFLWIRDPGRLTREKQTLVFEKGGMSGRKKEREEGANRLIMELTVRCSSIWGWRNHRVSRFFPPRADVTAETNRGRAESCGLRRASVASTGRRGYRLNTAMASDHHDERRPLIGRVDGSGARLDPSSPRALEEGAGAASPRDSRSLNRVRA